MVTQNLKQLIDQFAQTQSGQQKHLLKHMRTAMKNFILEALGQGTRALTPKEFSKRCEDLTIEWLIRELQKQEKDVVSFSDLMKRTFDRQLKVFVDSDVMSPETGKNYRSAIVRWSQWVERQPMFQMLYQKELPEVLPERIKVQIPVISTRKEEYAPPFSALPNNLLKEIADFKRFWITGGMQERLALTKQREEANISGRLSPKMTVKGEKQFKAIENRICLFFGYQTIKGVPPENWNLNLLTSIFEINGFSQFMAARGNTNANVLRVLEISIAVAKQKNFNITQRKDWSDIAVIQDLRELNQEFNKIYQRQRKANTKRKLNYKRLAHEQLQKVGQELLLKCAPFRGKKDKKTGKWVKGAKRSMAAIVWSYQTLIVVLILIYVAPRQQEPRQYELGVTLFRWLDEEGREIYVVRDIHHKSFYLEEETRSYRLPSILTPYLDTWLQEYRPLAQKAVQTIEDWLAFWGYKPDSLERLEQRIKKAEQGIFSCRVKDTTKYINELKKKAQGLRNRIAAREIVKQNFEAHNLTFFSLGIHKPETFGQSLSSQSVYSMVVYAIAQATQRLFGKAYRINPHSFRHIAALQVDKINGNKSGTANLLGHSQEMLSEYSSSWQDDLERTAGLDTWWEP